MLPVTSFSSRNIEQTGVLLDLAIRAAIHTGIALNQPCPICVGDTTAQDGSTDGLCAGGLRDGGACDVQGFDATFAAGEGISLDCPPDPLSNISGAGLQLALDLTTGSASLPFNVSCDFPLGAPWGQRLAPAVSAATIARWRVIPMENARAVPARATEVAKAAHRTPAAMVSAPTWAARQEAAWPAPS